MAHLKRILSSTLLLTAIFILMSCLPLFAEGGNGDGSGGGSGNPLALVSSDPASGSQNISLSTKITLTFNKNVINMSVRDNNMKCFELVAADGKKVPIQVVMADDQIEPEKKRIITIAPSAQLQPGIQYTLKIAPELQAKSGVSLGKTTMVTFTTQKPADSSNTSKTDVQGGGSQPAQGNAQGNTQGNSPVSSNSSSSAPDAKVSADKNQSVTNTNAANNQTVSVEQNATEQQGTGEVQAAPESQVSDDIAGEDASADQQAFDKEETEKGSPEKAKESPQDAEQGAGFLGYALGGLLAAAGGAGLIYYRKKA